MSTNEHKLAYSVTEAAQSLAVTERYVRKLVAEGVIPSLLIGKRRLIRREALADFLRKREQETSLAAA